MKSFIHADGQRKQNNANHGGCNSLKSWTVQSGLGSGQAEEDDKTQDYQYQKPQFQTLIILPHLKYS
uniref:Uncharacterized protein n=1 Tax=Oryza punctata TaxID=4537 RepID=A0A0E0JWM6_ORYPU